MKYNKDYFTGMEHLADAINYELGRLRDYYNEKEEKERTRDGKEYYSIFGEGIDKAIDVVNAVLHMQLEVKGEETE